MSDVGKGHLHCIVSSAAAAARSSLVKRNDFCGSCLDGGHVRESERSPEREMEDAGLCEVAVSEQSWVPVLVQGTELLAKAWFGDTRYRVLLSDLHCVWEEEMLAEAIGSRAQELNKRLRAPVQAFFTHLRCVAEPLLSGQAGSNHDGVEAPFSLLRHDDHLTVRLKSELAGVPFHWEFRLTPASVPVVCRQLVRPLLAMTRVLQRQVEELTGLLGRKDAEIQDYKENGAVLTRGRLLTDVFDEERYRQNFFSLTLPRVAAVQECVSFSPELQDLYAAVSSQRGGQRRRKRRRSSADTHTQEDDTHTPAQDQGPDHNTHTPAQDQRPEHHNTHTQDQGPEHNTHTDRMHEPGSRSSSDHGTTPGPGEQKNPGGGSSGEPQKSESEQTVPQMAAPVDRSVSRPKKKKAVGLFR